MLFLLGRLLCRIFIVSPIFIILIPNFFRRLPELAIYIDFKLKMLLLTPLAMFAFLLLAYQSAMAMVAVVLVAVPSAYQIMRLEGFKNGWTSSHEVAVQMMTIITTESALQIAVCSFLLLRGRWVLLFFSALVMFGLVCWYMTPIDVIEAHLAKNERKYLAIKHEVYLLLSAAYVLRIVMLLVAWQFLWAS